MLHADSLTPAIQMPLSSSDQDQARVSLMGEEEDQSTRKEDDSTEVKTGENESRDFLRNPRLVLFTVICVPVLIIFVILLVNLTKTKGVQRFVYTVY